MGLLLRIVAGVTSALALLTIPEIFWNVKEEPVKLAAAIWLGAWVGFEIIAFAFGRDVFARILTHLRYGPLAVAMISLTVVLTYDQSLILVSRMRIRQYVYASESSSAEFTQHLHNPYRGWCANGAFGVRYTLYGETAAAGFASDDPQVRVRSLRASGSVYDWLNRPDDGPFPGLLEQAERDPDPVVRQTAVRLRKEIHGFSD
jgi:hypothetical protein